MQTILILKRLFPWWECGLHELLDFSFSSFDRLCDNTFRSLYHFFFVVVVSITVDKMSGEDKVGSFLGEIKVVFQGSLHG